MEILDLPMDILWEANSASQSTFICSQIDEILANNIDEGLFSDSDVIQSDEESLNEKWLNQPLPITEISYQAPSDYFNFDNATAEDIIDVNNQPVIQLPSNEPIQIICSKENQFNPNSSSGLISNYSEITTIADSVDNSQVCQEFYASPVPLPNNYEDVAIEIQMVDELVRLRAQNLPNWAVDDNSLASSSTASSSPRSESSYNSSLGSSAAEWIPYENQPPSPVSSVSSGSSIGPIKARNKSTYKSGRMPSVEDKKYRKKEQNKNAANRYRQKKKAEVEIILEVEKDLERHNHDLTVKLSDVKREIKYIKNLMRELYRAKGILE